MKSRFAGTPARLVVFLGLAFVSVGTSNAGLREDERELLSEIKITRMMSTVEDLCIEGYRGRGAGSAECRDVADYLASEFRMRGLSVLSRPGLEGYKQPFTIRHALVRSKDEIKATLSYDMPGRRGPTERIRLFAYRGFNGRGGLDLSSEVVFVGWGVCDPASGCDSYAGLDVTGKIVVWLAGKPKGMDLSVGVTDAHKMVTAYRHGAAACIVSRPAGAKYGLMTNVGVPGAIADFPCIAVDENVASELLSPAEVNVGRLLLEKPHHLPTGARGVNLRLQITPICDPDRRVYNVIGMVPGTDPRVAHEVVLIGAHYDHIGYGASGEVFQGADDNASGVSVILELARGVLDAGLRPRRTIVFAAWTGEEANLAGSNHFVENPPFPLGDMVSCVHVEMVGAGTPGVFVTTNPSPYSEGYRHLLTSVDDLGFALETDVSSGSSDYLPFLRRRVPSFLICSAGEHPNYHTTGDTPAAVNRKVLESAARLATLVVWRAANT